MTKRLLRLIVFKQRSKKNSSYKVWENLDSPRLTVLLAYFIKRIFHSFKKKMRLKNTYSLNKGTTGNMNFVLMLVPEIHDFE